MFQHIRLRLHERAVIVRDGQAVRALGPGSHTFWRRHEVTLWDTHALTFTAPATLLAENPVLMRLKELETMKDIADQIDELKLVVGLDGLKGFLPLAGGKDS